MIQPPSARPRPATFVRLLAALTMSALMQAGAAWAGPFTVDVYLDNYEPDSSTSGMVSVNVMLGMSVDVDDWYLKSFTWADPRNDRGETLDFYVNRYINWYDLTWETGSIHVPLGIYLYWPGDTFGRFTGGEIVVTAVRYAEDDWMRWEPVEEHTERVSFDFVVLGPAVSVPEPAAAIPAAIAALGGAAYAAFRRRRAG
jgi:hypothetical protein